MLHCFHLLVQVLICLIILKKEEKSLKNMSYQNYRRQVPPKESVFVSAPNTTVLIVVGILVVFGLMSIFSAGAPESIERGQNPAHFALMQRGGRDAAGVPAVPRGRRKPPGGQDAARRDREPRALLRHDDPALRQARRRAGRPRDDVRAAVPRSLPQRKGPSENPQQHEQRQDGTRQRA